jgi:RimJ/RimL family protein N-acetyltransferase
MPKQPTLETDRLRLRPFRQSDAPDILRLVGDREVAATTLRIPHPYEEGMAEAWLAVQEEELEQGRGVHFAILRRSDEAFVGAIGLSLQSEHARAELGYWIGRPYWHQGYATEAAAAVIRYGFDVLGLNRILAHHMARNPASGRVMQKLGMQREGLLRQHVWKWGQFEDVVVYAILREEIDRGPTSR